MIQLGHKKRLTLKQQLKILQCQKEQMLEKAEGTGLDENSHLFESTNVSMGREYLKAYKIFEDEVQKIQPKLR